MADGLHNTCKSCRKTESALHYKENKKETLSRNKLWYLTNKKKHQLLVQNWYKRNIHARREKDIRRYAAKVKAVPVWVDLILVKDMYMEASYQGLHVDHIVPLISDTVCGLHWEGNLQLLTQSENASKGNRHWPNM